MYISRKSIYSDKIVRNKIRIYTSQCSTKVLINSANLYSHSSSNLSCRESSERGCARLMPSFVPWKQEARAATAASSPMQAINSVSLHLQMKRTAGKLNNNCHGKERNACIIIGITSCKTLYLPIKWLCLYNYNKNGKCV